MADLAKTEPVVYLYYKNESHGYFTDGKISLRPKQVAKIEKGKESKLVIQAFKQGGLSMSPTAPEGFKEGKK